MYVAGIFERDFDIMELRLQQISYTGQTSWLLHCTSCDTDAYWSMAGQPGPRRFTSAHAARAFAEQLGYELNLEPLPAINLDEIAGFCRQSRPVSADHLYHAWNFFGDLARTLGESFGGYLDVGLEVQEELFWSSSVAGYDGPAEFTHSQAQKLECVISEGLERWNRTHAPLEERLLIPA